MKTILTMRQVIFFILISGLIFVSTDNLQAKQNQKIFTIVSTGTQKIVSNFSPETKKQAVSAALQTSVERAVSEIIVPELFAANFETLYRNILSNPSKYILNYSVVAELKQETRYVAAVKVKINLTRLKKYLKRYGVIKNNSAKPSVLVLISEQSQDDISPKYWWKKDSIPYESLISGEITKLLTDEEFIVTGRNTKAIDLKKLKINFSSIYDVKAAIKLGSKLKADIIILGKAESFEALNRMGQKKTYEADISFDMWNVAAKKKITTIKLKATANDSDNEKGNKTAMLEAGTLAAKEISLRACKYWEENILKKEHFIETRIEGEDYLSSFILLRKTLNNMQGIKRVQTKELGADQAIVSILFKGNADKLAQALLLKTFKSFGLEIYNVKDRSLTIKFVPKI